MPIYEYACRACRHRFEQLVSLRQTEAPPCPRCGTPGAERALSVFAVGRSEAPRPAGCGSPDCACRSEWN